MSKITRKLVLSLLTVVLTVVALGTTTFAWFTLTNTSTVQPFEAEVIGDSGIEIALGAHGAVELDPTAYDWKTTLSTADINDYIATAYPTGFYFGHVTTADAITFRTLDVASMPIADTDTYLAIPLNFRSNSATSIEWTAVTLSSSTYNWTVDVGFTGVGATPVVYAADDVLGVDASNAMRIAMVSQNGASSYTVGYEKGAQALPYNAILDGDGAAQNLADGVGVGEGDAGAMNYYYEKSGQAGLPFGASAVTVLDTLQDLAAGQTVVDMEDVSGGAIDFEADYYGQVMVYIWLEGWDANAFNSILSQIVSTSFVFVGV
eukprot:Anaeramoba_ignava/a90141_120.p4 GENE.a90141_120~~a90141_120.p4  ORF type:complete len:319 (-),score=53.76 a90141_120:6612-7568(-)